MRPSVVVTHSRSFTPPVVATLSRNTGAPSTVAGSVTWYRSVSAPTFAGVRMVSAVFRPLCCESPPNCSQS
jgi:hypothetical protein